jgi:hypothetical protein
MARLQGNTRIYGTANVDTSIGIGGNVVVNASTLFIGNSTINTFISTTGLTINNNANVSFRTINASAVVSMRQQNDDNFVFYSTNTAYGQRAIWSVFANSITSALSVSTDLSASANLSFNSGFGSAAIAYGCRAWIAFSGATPTISNNGNVSSLTKNATGNYTINFTNAMPDANYAFSGGVMKHDTGDDGNIIIQVGGNSANTPKVGSIRCITRIVSGSTLVDSAFASVMIFR